MRCVTTPLLLITLCVSPPVKGDLVDSGGWAVCPLREPIEREAKSGLPVTASLPASLYLDQRPALLNGEAVRPENKREQYWSRSAMVKSFGSQSIQVISVPKKVPDEMMGEKVPSNDLRVAAEANENQGVRGKPVTMAISAFVDLYLGCPQRAAYWSHTRPYVFSGARALLRLLEYNPPRIMSQTRPSKEVVIARPSPVANSSSTGGAYVYIEYLSMGGVGTGLKYHRHTEAWTEVMYGRKLWLLHEPRCTMEQIWSDVAPQCPKGRCEVFYGMPPASHKDGLVLDTYLDTILPKLPDRGTTNDTCLEKPLLVVQNKGEVFYLPAQWWHFTYNLDDTVGVTMHVITKAKRVRAQSGARSFGLNDAGPGKSAGKRAGPGLSRSELNERFEARLAKKHSSSMQYFTTTPGLPSHGPAPANNKVLVEGRVPYSERRRPHPGSSKKRTGKKRRSYIAP